MFSQASVILFTDEVSTRHPLGRQPPCPGPTPPCPGQTAPPGQTPPLSRHTSPLGRGGVCSQGGVCSRGVCSPGGLLPGASAPGGWVSQHALRQTPLPPVDRHTLVKILPWPNFVAAGKNVPDIMWLSLVLIVTKLCNIDVIKSSSGCKRATSFPTEQIYLQFQSFFQNIKKLYRVGAPSYKNSWIRR